MQSIKFHIVFQKGEQDMMDNSDYNVLDSALRLARALKRNAPRHGHMLPPAVERTIITLSENNGISSGELCDFLGIRPSSLSELIDRIEKHGLAQRSVDDQDKRIVRISLTEKGAELAAKISEEFNARKAALEECFEDGEAEQFCALADKLSACLQGGEDDLPPFSGHGPRGRHGCRRGPHGFGPGHAPEHGSGPEMHSRACHREQCHDPQFRHPGPWDCHRQEFGHHGPEHCRKHEFGSCRRFY